MHFKIVQTLPRYCFLCIKKQTKQNKQTNRNKAWPSVFNAVFLRDRKISSHGYPVRKTKTKHDVKGGAILPGIGFLFAFLLATSLVYQDINE